MRWVWLFIAGIGLCGLSLMVYFANAGSYVDSNGYVVEEFWAWGLGTILLAISIFSAAMILVGRLITSRLKRSKGE